MKKTRETVETYTTAPADYDRATTRDLGAVGTTGGKVVRMVETPAHLADDQRDRYASGLHMAVSLDGWRKLAAFRLAEPTEAAALALRALDVADVARLAQAVRNGHARPAGAMVDAFRFGGEGWTRARIVAALASHDVSEADFEAVMAEADSMEAAS
jgi:hypothetical protein